MTPPLCPKKVRVRGDAPVGWPDADRVLVCEGLARPSKGCEWRVVAFAPRGMPALTAEREAETEFFSARGELRSAEAGANPRGPRVTQDMRDRALDRLRTAQSRFAAAVSAQAAAVRAARAFLATLADPALGVALIPGDCPDVEFRP